MATQTPENIETDILEGEEDFQRNKIDEVRKKFIVDEIKAEDFDSDYENGNEEENIVSPDAVLRPNDAIGEDQSESEKQGQSKKDIEKEQVHSEYEDTKKKKLFVHEIQSKGQMRLQNKKKLFLHKIQ